MKPAARRAWGTPPVDGDRIETRATLACPATLYAGAQSSCSVALSDLSPRGCRIVTRSPAAVGAHVALMLDGRTLISGRVAWRGVGELGIDFCAPLLPRIVQRLTAEHG